MCTYGQCRIVLQRARGSELRNTHAGSPQRTMASRLATHLTRRDIPKPSYAAVDVCAAQHVPAQSDIPGYKPISRQCTDALGCC